MAQHIAWPSLETAPTLEQGSSSDVALIIAIERYDHLPDIGGVLLNARDWEIFFRHGLRMRQVYTLVNHEATREEIERLAQVAAAAAGEESRLWVLFIGHGTPAPGGEEGALVGSDARQTVNSLAQRSLNQSRLLELLQAGAQRETVIILDTCFSGQTRDGQALAEGAMPVVPVAAKPAVPSSVVMMTAAKADQFAGALPGASRPAFSYLLLGALRGWAADDEGTVRAAEAVSFARHHLHGIAGREQTPEIVGEGTLVLARGAREPDPLLGQLSIQLPSPSEENAPVRRAPTELAVATVNGESIGVSDFQLQWRHVANLPGRSAEVDEHTRDQIINELIYRELFRQAVEKANITVPREAVEARIAEDRERFAMLYRMVHGEEKSFDEAIAELGLSAIDIYIDMEKHLGGEHLLVRHGARLPGEEDIRSHFEANQEAYGGRSFEEVRLLIAIELREQALSGPRLDLLQRLLHEAEIEIHLENIRGI